MGAESVPIKLYKILGPTSPCWATSLTMGFRRGVAIPAAATEASLLPVCKTPKASSSEHGFIPAQRKSVVLLCQGHRNVIQVGLLQSHQVSGIFIETPSFPAAKGIS